MESGLADTDAGALAGSAGITHTIPVKTGSGAETNVSSTRESSPGIPVVDCHTILCKSHIPALRCI